jgi:hypothetical protein
MKNRFVRVVVLFAIVVTAVGVVAEVPERAAPEEIAISAEQSR